MHSDPAPAPRPTPTPVPTPKPTPSVDLRQQSISGGYGTNIVFPLAVYSGNTPHNEIRYYTTDPTVADVNERGGIALLTPGSAEIVAVFPQDDNFEVRVPVIVENHFAWDYTWHASPLTLAAGTEDTQFLANMSRPQDSEVTSADWSIADSSIAQIVSAGSAANPNFCRLKGLSPGTTTLTAVFHFSLTTNAGPRSMSDTISCTIVVN